MPFTLSENSTVNIFMPFALSDSFFLHHLFMETGEEYLASPHHTHTHTHMHAHTHTHTHTHIYMHAHTHTHTHTHTLTHIIMPVVCVDF